MSLSPRADAALLRLAKGVAFGTLVLVLDAGATLLTSNTLGLAPTVSTLLAAYVVPVLMAGEKWAHWEQSQAAPSVPGYPKS